MKSTATRIALFKDSIFGTMSRLAREHNAVNLGQGFPDFDGPEWLKQIVQLKIQEGHSQYAPFMGTPRLREEVSSYYQRFYSMSFNPETEVTVTCGATEGVFSTILACVNPGDEVLVFEPFYDSYVASIELAGGKAVPVSLHAPGFNVVESELTAAISQRTKLMILNNPHNPSGKVWSKTELEMVAKIALKHDLFVISDEVYEFLLFDGAVHLPFASLPHMSARTFTVSSAGKTFGLTGWKIGWVCAPPELSRALRLVHQYVTFSVSTPMQEAVAEGLSRLEDHIPNFQRSYQAKRDFFHKGLAELGFDFLPPQSTYFMMVPIGGKTTKNDMEFAIELAKERKVVAIPPSSFYLKSSDGHRHLRFCFAKKEETLAAALKQLQGL